MLIYKSTKIIKRDHGFGDINKKIKRIIRTNIKGETISN